MLILVPLSWIDKFYSLFSPLDYTFPSRFITNNFVYVSLGSWGFGLFHLCFFRVHFLPVSMVISQWYVSISALAVSLPVLFFSVLDYFFFEVHIDQRKMDWAPEHSCFFFFFWTMISLKEIHLKGVKTILLSKLSAFSFLLSGTC